MSDFLTLLTECRDFLSDLTALLNALDSIDTDELVVNVDQSVLPPLAATTTNQATAITALQKIDDLQDALESKALDRLLVRSMDQLHSYQGIRRHSTEAVISGAGGFIDSATPTGGKLWYITHIALRDQTSPITRIRLMIRRAGANYIFHEEPIALAITDHATFRSSVWLEPTEVIRAYYIGALAGDTCRLYLTGHTMTQET